MAEQVNEELSPVVVVPPVSHPTAGWRHYLRAIGAIVWKDITTEWRNRQVVSAMLVFALLVILIFNFALELDRTARETVASGVLWVTFVFAATLGLNRTFAPELDRGSLDGLLLAPIDRTALFFAKLISTLLFIFVVEAMVIPVFSVLYNMPLFEPLFLVVVVLGTLGYVAVGTLLAAMSVHIRAREVMLPVLLFPVTVPVILASVKASSEILAGAAWERFAAAFNLVVVFDVIFIAIAVILFDYLVEQ